MTRPDRRAMAMNNFGKVEAVLMVKFIREWEFVEKNGGIIYSCGIKMVNITNIDGLNGVIE